MLVNLLNEADKSEVISYCSRLYGIDVKAWDNRELVKTKDALWLISSDILEFTNSTDIEFESLGMRCFSGASFPYKVTDGLYKVFKGSIQKRKLPVLKEQALKLLKGEEIELDKGEEYPFDGYVFLFYGETYFGIALKKGDLLISQIPKSFRSQLAKDLEIRD